VQSRLLQRWLSDPEGLELPTFWFVVNGVKMLNALFGVAYGLGTPFFPQLAAPKSCTQNRIISNLHRMSTIRKAEFGHAATASPATPVSDCLCIICAVASCGLAFELRSRSDL